MRGPRTSRNTREAESIAEARAYLKIYPATSVLCVDPCGWRSKTGWTGYAYAYHQTIQHVGITQIVEPSRGALGVLVIEMPEVYPQSEEDLNDLLDVAWTGGKWEQAWSADHVVRVRPKTWKKQVPKPIHNARVLYALSADEKAMLEHIPESKKHNALDAVGLWLWLTGRS